MVYQQAQLGAPAVALVAGSRARGCLRTAEAMATVQSTATTWDSIQAIWVDDLSQRFQWG
jgi:hypothetical protein